MFLILRIIVGALIVTPIYYLKSKIRGKAHLGTYIIAGCIIISLLSFIPFENLIYTFDSPEESYTYASMNTANLEQIIQGTDSSFVLGSFDDGGYNLIIPKSENGWKLGLNAFPTRNIMSNGYFIHVYHAIGCNDYFIEVYNLSDIEFSVTDSLNSEFIQIESNYSNSAGTFITYYAVIPFKDKNYTLYVDGNEYHVFQNEGLKDFFNSIISN